MSTTGDTLLIGGAISFDSYMVIRRTGRKGKVSKYRRMMTTAEDDRATIISASEGDDIANMDSLDSFSERSITSYDLSTILDEVTTSGSSSSSNSRSSSNISTCP